MIEIASIRKDYQLKTLDIVDVENDPLKQFNIWFEEAVASKVNEPNAMVLSTVKENGRPAARVVLLKGTDQSGFSFFTNYESDKGHQLLQFPFASLTFFWPELERQVRVEGKVKKLSELESNNYFSIRPRNSRIGAYASPQSKVVPGREFLEDSFRENMSKFEGMEVERPSYWGGYSLNPDYFEFWQGRPSRLHDRISYHLLIGQDWDIKRLAP